MLITFLSFKAVIVELHRKGVITLEQSNQTVNHLDLCAKWYQNRKSTKLSAINDLAVITKYLLEDDLLKFSEVKEQLDLMREAIMLI